MQNKKSYIFTQILVFVLSVVLAGNCLFCAGGNIFSTNREERSASQLNSVQKQRVRTSKIVETLDNFEEVLRYRTENRLPSRSATRLFQPVFSALILAGLSNPLTRGFLGNSNNGCFSNTAIVDYIHNIDGKIKG